LQDIVQGFLEAIRLVITGDPELAEIVWLSLRVSGIALLISTLLGIPAGVLLGLRRVPAHGFVTATLYTGMGLPPVVVGLFVYLMLSRSGPFGALGWLFTPKAMVVAQSIIAFPLVAGLTMAAVRSVDPAPAIAWYVHPQIAGDGQ
jgi:tungstate transport system permease protein